MIEQAEFIVTCDECGDDTRVELNGVSFPILEKEIEKELEKENWHFGDKTRGEWQCESCYDAWQAELEAEESDGE